MAKRFTDSEKWLDPWFMDLPTKYKLFYLYLLDNCNHAGVWKVNFRVASFNIGEHLEHSEVKRVLKGRINFISEEYWYINKFIKYQYKTEIQGLNPKNKAHLSVIKLLNDFDEFKPLTSPLLGVKDKDKDKDNNSNLYLLNNIKKENKEKSFDIDGILSIEEIKKEYLSNSKVLESLVNEPKNKLNNIDELKNFLDQFCSDLIQEGRNVTSRKDFGKYFLNCVRKGKFKLEAKKSKNIPKENFISNPYNDF